MLTCPHQTLPLRNSRDWTSSERWLKDYVELHNEAIENGRLKRETRYIVYQCTEDEACGGLGDRALSMVNVFYLAMATGRVLVIDSPFPVPLESILNPNFIQWNASFPETTQHRDVMKRSRAGMISHNDTGYRVERCNGYGRWTLRQILRSKRMKAYFAGKGFTLDPDASLADMFRLAYWTMFIYDARVLSKAESIKEEAGLTGSYMGLHIRSGDSAMSSIYSERKFVRGTDRDMLRKCFHRYRKEVFANDENMLGFLAADNEKDKLNFARTERDVRISETKPFHVDQTSRSEMRGKVQDTTDKKENNDIFEATVATYAENVVLMDSSCLIMSWSMFSFVAYYIRGGNTQCAIYVGDCFSDNVVLNGKNEYFIQPGMRNYLTPKALKSEERLSVG